MKRLIMTTLIATPALVFAHKNSPVSMSQVPLDISQAGYICLSNDAIHEGEESFELVSDSQSVSNPTVFVFDPKRYTFAAYRDGELVRTGRASGGADYCSELGRSCRTPVGRFRVYSLGSADCKSSKYPLPTGGAPMPHCMFFHGGAAVHASPYVPLDNASHGCIRVNPQDAKWLRHNFMQVGTEVVVRSY